jgi:nucleotide-binding universal stress UspA family protein
MVPFQTILCPTDFSDCAREAFHLACSLARQHGARLIVLHVVDVLYGKQTYAGIGVEVRPADYPKRALERLKEWRAPYPEVQVEYLVTEGDPVEEILREAAAKKADGIVIGTHGLTGLRRVILGSIAEQVLRRAPCPVVTTRPAHNPS